MSDRGTANAGNTSGATVVELIKSLVNQWPMALTIDEAQFKNSQPLPSGYTLQGDIPKNLDDLARQFDFTWTQSLGAIVVTKNDADRNTSIFEVNELSGMVGIPEVTRGPSGMGVNVTCRINPAIKIDSRIRINSRFSTYNTGNSFWVENTGGLNANGDWNVFTLRYEGDTHGDAWNMHIDGMKPGTAATPPVDATGSLVGGALTWGAKVDEAFRNKVKSIATNQKLDPNWYMAIMALETGESFDPAQPNGAGGSARGLIQFMPQVARELGTTSQELVMMTAVQQLDYVEKYFNKYRSNIRTFADMYMAVLWPIATSWSLDKVIWDKDGSTAAQYRANSGLDIDKDGKITKLEAFTRVQQRFEKGLKYAK